MKKIIYILTMFLIISCSSKRETVVYNILSPIETLNPKLIRDSISQQVNTMINEGLLEYSEEDNRYLGALAKSFTETEKKLIFEIKDDIYWSNGDKITVDDFVYGLKLSLEKTTASQYADMLFSIKNAEKYNRGEVDFEAVGIKKIDDKRLKIELEKPTSYFKYILTLPISYPINQKIYEKYGDEYGTTPNKTIYSGAYVVNKMTESEIYLTKNNHYYDKKNIKIHNFQLVAINNFQVVDNLIQNGELDISRVENKYYDKYINNNELKTYYNARVWYLEYNFKNRLMQNYNFRKAINIAINREQYVHNIKKDGSKVAKSLISDIMYASDIKFREKYSDKTYIEDVDIDLAKKYLNKALTEENLTIEDVNRMKLIFLAGNSDPEKQEAEYLQEYFREHLGISFNVFIVPFRERLHLTREGKFDIVLNTWSPKYVDTSAILRRWYNKDSQLSSVYNKTEADELYYNAMQLPNGDVRDDKLAQMEKILIKDVLITPLYFSVENLYINNKIKGIKIQPISNIINFKEAYKGNK